MLPAFDNHDSRIRYWELALIGSLDEIGDDTLPAGYHYETYAPGDREAWLAIEQSAKEFDSREEGLRAWEAYYGGQEDRLPGRMWFAVDEKGEKAATATAWHDIRGRDLGGDGMLHWVAVARAHQGRGLSKPLINHVLRVMREEGARKARIPTQTTTWLAVKVYLDLGFRPIEQNAVRSGTGWRIIRRLTDHPALAAFPPAEDAEVLAEKEGEHSEQE